MDSDNFLFVDVTKDLELCGKMLEKFNTLFMKCILLELLTDRNDPTSENKNLVFPLIRALIGLYISVSSHSLKVSGNLLVLSYCKCCTTWQQ